MNELYYPNTYDRRAEIAREIAQAFSATEYPTENYLRFDILPEFSGPWDELPSALITKHRGSVFDLSLKRFVYYLPAIIRHVLLWPKDADYMIDFLPSHLSPYRSESRRANSSPDYSAWVLRNLNQIAALLTKEQIQSVILLLSEYASIFPDYQDIDDATIDGALEFWKAKLAEK